MKHIIPFNEKLSPKVYKSAAIKLRKLGHENRFQKLSNWANE